MQHNISTSQRNSTTNFNASYSEDGCIKCSFSDDSASSCVVVAFNKSQTISKLGITYIDVFQFMKKGTEAYGCIEKHAEELNIIVFTFNKQMRSISGSGLVIKSVQQYQGEILNSSEFKCK